MEVEYLLTCGSQHTDIVKKKKLMMYVVKCQECCCAIKIRQIAFVPSNKK